MTDIPAPGDNETPDLVELAALLIEVMPQTAWARVHPSKYPGREYNPTQQHTLSTRGGRFDSVKRGRRHFLFDPYAYTYLAMSSADAADEAIIGRRWLGKVVKPRSKVPLSSFDDAVLSHLRNVNTFTVVDLTDHRAIERVGLPPQLCKTDNYRASRQWLSWLRVRSGVEICGVRYLGRLSDGPVIALFRALTNDEWLSEVDGHYAPIYGPPACRAKLRTSKPVPLTSNEGMVFLLAVAHQHKLTLLPR